MAISSVTLSYSCNYVVVHAPMLATLPALAWISEVLRKGETVSMGSSTRGFPYRLWLLNNPGWLRFARLSLPGASTHLPLTHRWKANLHHGGYWKVRRHIEGIYLHCLIKSATYPIHPSTSI